MILIVVIILGFLIGYEIRVYLDHRSLKLPVGSITTVVLFAFVVYSIAGIFTNEYTKVNGNICRGFPDGIKVCRGDINAE